jgi:hypothetical protein
MSDPTQALRALLQPGELSSTLYPPNSRYHGIGTATLTRSDGQQIVYLRRRLVPPPEEFTAVQEHTVVQGDRPDNLAVRYLGDAEQFWRLCDGNGVMRPDELTEDPGERVLITLPHGIAGRGNA